MLIKRRERLGLRDVDEPARDAHLVLQRDVLLERRDVLGLAPGGTGSRPGAGRSPGRRWSANVSNVCRLRAPSSMLTASENWARTPPAALLVEPEPNSSLLDQDDVGDSGAGQVVGGAEPDDTAADDHHGGAGRQRCGCHRPPPQCATGTPVRPPGRAGPPHPRGLLHKHRSRASSTAGEAGAPAARHREPMTTTRTGTTDAGPADVLVVFGITGDLARVMTFRSLYRLEARGLLDCPIVGRRGRRLDGRPAGRAGPHLDRGRPARRSTRRSSSGSPTGCRTSAATSPTPRRTGASVRRSRAPRPRCFYLEIPPFLFGKVVKGLAEAGLSHGRALRDREAVRPRPAVGARPRRRAAPVRRRVAAVPDRPLPREDGPRGDPAPALRQRDPRADLEPQLPRVRPDHDGRELRGRRPRAASTTRSARCATSWSTT